MENERVIELSWLERFNIRRALTLEIERMKELRDTAMRLNMGNDTVRAIENVINDYLRIVDKMRDKD